MIPQTGVILGLVIDSDDTTTGGGCASALSGAMAAGMISMVAKLSKKKPVNLTNEAYDAIAAECDELARRLENGAVADRHAYQGIVDAFKLPKNTEEEKRLRSAQVQAAAIRAAEVPRDNGQMNARVHELAVALKGNSNPACMSDLQCALQLSENGVKGCVLNIQANLSLIKNAEKTAQLKDSMLQLLLDAICY